MEEREVVAQDTKVKVKKKYRTDDEMRDLEAQILSDKPSDAQKNEHRFWDTQPVPKITAHMGHQMGAIDGVKKVEDIPSEPLPLRNEGFEWCEVDMMDEGARVEVYELLRDNYVEDNDAQFRFEYSSDFLRWSLTPPGYLPEWHIGVRREGTLVAFISAIPLRMNVYGANIRMVEINYLCVAKGLRSVRLAPLLIKEITRRVNRQDIWQATFTAGILIPRPVCKAQYYHRSLSPRKLIAIGFSYLPRRMTMTQAVLRAKVRDTISIPGFRPFDPKRDAKVVSKLLNRYNEANYRCYPTFRPVDVLHYFTMQEDIVQCFVVEDPQTGKVTDMMSYYCIPSSILHHPKYKWMKVAYCYYYFAFTHSPKALMEAALTMAVKQKYDLFNCLNTNQNASFLEALRFAPGDGNLHYYFFNWQCPPMPPNEMGLVLT